MLQLYKEKCFIYANWVSVKLVNLILAMGQEEKYTEILQKARKVQ